MAKKKKSSKKKPVSKKKVIKSEGSAKKKVIRKKAESKKKKPAELKLSSHKSPLQRWGGWVLFALAFLLYANTLSHDFTFDDSIVITGNQFTQKGVNGIGDLMTRDFFEGIYGDKGMELTGGRYRPLSLVMFAIENQLFGKEKKQPNGQLAKADDGSQLYEYPQAVGHFLNVFFYALTAFFLFQLLTIWFPGKEGVASAVPIIAGLIFVCHPLHTEVVANIKSRDEIMALLFLVLSFITLHKSAKKFNMLTIALGGLAYFAAMLAKEHAFTFIVIFPLSLFIFEKELKWGKIAQLCLPFWIIAVIYLMIRQAMVGGMETVENTDILENPMYGVAMMEQLATIAHVLFRYLALLVVPHPLTADYSREHIEIVSFADPMAIMGLLIHIGLAFWVLRYLFFVLMGKAKQGIYALSILIYFIPLSLTINLLFNIGAPMAERFLYVSTFGYSLAVAYGLSQLFKLRSVRHLMKAPAALAIVAALAIAYSVKTVLRNPAWKDNKTLFSTDIHTSANSAKMNYYYGNTLFKEYLAAPAGQGDTSLLHEAERHFRRSVEIYPEFTTGLYNLGFANIMLKRPDEAEKHLLKVIEKNPGHLNSLEQLGRLYGELKQDFAKSEQYLKQAAAINQQHGNKAKLAGNYQGLGNIYAMQQKLPQAVNYYQQAVNIQPNVTTLMNMGFAYKQMGNAQKAQEAFQQAKKLDPKVVIPK